MNIVLPKPLRFVKTLPVIGGAILLLLIISLISGKDEKPSTLQTVEKKTIAVRNKPQIPDTWKTFSSDIITFRYPPEWSQRPIQIYPGNDTIIPFDFGSIYFFTLTFRPYDSTSFSEEQKIRRITLDSITELNHEKYKNVLIDNHKAKRLHDPVGEKGIRTSSDTIIIDIPEKRVFVTLGFFRNPVQSLGFETVVDKWINPLVSSIQLGEQEEVISLQTIPSSQVDNWKKYRKQFQGLQFEFNYPAHCSIQDSDEASGDIGIVCNQAEGVGVAISRLHGQHGYVTDFEGGSKKEWFINKMIDDTPPAYSIDRKKIKFSGIQFLNGTQYFQVTYPDNQGFNYLNTETHDFYFGVPFNKGIAIFDYRKLPREQVHAILQTLIVK